MVFLSLAYLQWRLVCRRLLDPTLVGETVADMIRLLRHEHLVSLITAVAKAAKTRLRVQMVVKRFLPPVATASEYLAVRRLPRLRRFGRLTRNPVHGCG